MSDWWLEDYDAELLQFLLYSWRHRSCEFIHETAITCYGDVFSLGITICVLTKPKNTIPLDIKDVFEGRFKSLI